MATQSSTQDLKDWFESNGLSIAEWAASNGFSKTAVYAALSGRTRGRRGEAHAVALALGLKAPPKPGLAGPVLKFSGSAQMQDSRAPEGATP